MFVETASQTELESALRRVAELEVALASTTTELKAVRAERDKLRRAYEQLKAHLELLRRRIFVAKAERIDTSRLGDLDRRRQRARAESNEHVDESSASTSLEATSDVGVTIRLR